MTILMDFLILNIIVFIHIKVHKYTYMYHTYLFISYLVLFTHTLVRIFAKICIKMDLCSWIWLMAITSSSTLSFLKFGISIILASQK